MLGSNQDGLLHVTERSFPRLHGFGNVNHQRGLAINIQNNEIVCEGLLMSHSPGRWGDNLIYWGLDSAILESPTLKPVPQKTESGWKELQKNSMT